MRAVLAILVLIGVCVAAAQDEREEKEEAPASGYYLPFDEWEEWFAPHQTSAAPFGIVGPQHPGMWFPLWPMEPDALTPMEWIFGLAMQYGRGEPAYDLPYPYGGSFLDLYRAVWGGAVPFSFGPQPALPYATWGFDMVHGAGSAVWGPNAAAVAKRIRVFNFTEKEPENLFGSTLFGGTYDAYGGSVTFANPFVSLAAGGLGSDLWAVHAIDPRIEDYTACGALNLQLGESRVAITPWFLFSSMHYSWPDPAFPFRWHQVSNGAGVILTVPVGNGAFFFRPGWIEETRTVLTVWTARGYTARLGWHGQIAGENHTTRVLFETYLDFTSKRWFYNNMFGVLLRTTVNNYDLLLQKLVMFKRGAIRLGGRLHNTSWSGDVDEPYRSLFLPFAALLFHAVPGKISLSFEWSRTIGIPTIPLANVGCHEEHIQSITGGAAFFLTPNLALRSSYTHQHLTDAMRWGTNFGTQRSDITTIGMEYRSNSHAFVGACYSHVSRRDWNASSIRGCPPDYGSLALGYNDKKWLIALNFVAHTNYLGIPTPNRWHRLWLLLGIRASKRFHILTRVDIPFRQRGDRRLYMEDHLIYGGIVIIM